MIQLNLVEVFLFLSITGNLFLLYSLYKKNQEIKKIIEEHEEQLEEIEDLATQNKLATEKAYSDAMKQAEKELEIYQKYILNLNTAIHLSDDKLKELDVRGTFEADDEIGFFFKNVKNIQNILNEFKVEIQKS